MNQGVLDSHLVTTFILSCCALLVMLLGFFIKTWVVGLTSTLKELSANIHDMTDVVSDLRQEQAVHRLRIKQQAIEIRKLQNSSCANPECKPLTRRSYDEVTDGESGGFDVTGI